MHFNCLSATWKGCLWLSGGSLTRLWWLTALQWFWSEPCALIQRGSVKSGSRRQRGLGACCHRNSVAKAPCVWPEPKAPELMRLQERASNMARSLAEDKVTTMTAAALQRARDADSSDLNSTAIITINMHCTAFFPGRKREVSLIITDVGGLVLLLVRVFGSCTFVSGDCLGKHE